MHLPSHQIIPHNYTSSPLSRPHLTLPSRQATFNQHVFSAEQELYRSEGIAWRSVAWPDNSGAISLISMRERGWQPPTSPPPTHSHQSPPQPSSFFPCASPTPPSLDTETSPRLLSYFPASHLFVAPRPPPRSTLRSPSPQSFNASPLPLADILPSSQSTPRLNISFEEASLPFQPPPTPSLPQALPRGCFTFWMRRVASLARAISIWPSDFTRRTGGANTTVTSPRPIQGR